MSDFGAQELARDAIAIMADTLAATWNSVAYDGVAGALVTTKPNQMGGFLPEYDLSWTTTIEKLNDARELVSRFPGDVLPAEGEPMTIRDIAYKIHRVSKDPFEVMVQFDLVNENKH